MKKVLLFILVLFTGIALSAQDLQKLATKGAVRFFGDKDDLTSVIQIVPDGTVVEVIKADSVFTLVQLGETQGYIRSDRLTAALPALPVVQPEQEMPAVQEQQAPAMQQEVAQQEYIPEDRYGFLANKYGDDIGKRLYQHKVWKGVSSDMARDSWGKPKQINRMYVDQSVEEEWIYSKKYLYFRDGVLIDWGPVK
jgi:hypothetical protein